MHREEIDLDSRLRIALDSYEMRSGRRPPLDDVDPRRHPSAYRRFSDASHRSKLAPDRGEWIDLEMGRKPMVRLVLDEPTWHAMGPDCSARGYATAALPCPVAEASLGRLTTAPAKDPRIVVFVGRDPKRVAEAAELDGELLLSDTSTARTWHSLGRRLGALLGYPDCCVDHFVGLEPWTDNHDVVRAVAQNSKRFDPLLNNLSLSLYHTICWYPCRYDCTASLQIARAVDLHVRARAPVAHNALTRILAMPRIYLDDRRQLIIDGTPDESGRFHFQTIYSPFTFDRQPGDVFVDWVFHVDVVERLLEARWMHTTKTGLRIGRGSRELGEIELGGSPVSLPFGYPGQSLR